MRQDAPQRDANQQHGGRRQKVHAAPAEILADRPADHPRQQNAHQQAGHYGADNFAALRLRRQCRGGRHDILRYRCGHADHEAGE